MRLEWTITATYPGNETRYQPPHDEVTKAIERLVNNHNLSHQPGKLSFQIEYATKGENRMSHVMWCDPGNHAFKAGEPGSQSFTGTSVDDDGNPIRMEMDACKDHSFRPTTDETAKAIGNSH